MKYKDTEFMKKRIMRRIIVKTLVLGFWAVSMVALMINQGIDVANGILLYMTVAIVAAWAVSTFRDVRRLRNSAYLERATIAETDERNVLLAYKSTRLAVVVVGCAAPVAIYVLSYFGMEESVNAVAAVIGFFAMAYLASWAYLNRTC